jgi:hypothetical protein
MRLVSRPTSTAVAIARKDDQARRTRQAIIAFAAASAVALCSLAIAARADTWVTVGPDGSVTRTQTAARDNGADQNRYPNNDQNAQRGGVVNNTTIYAGTLYPVPYAYPYYNPGGVTYNTHPPIGDFQPPTITTLPSTGYAYGYSPYGYPSYGYPPYGYPAPVYSSPYPLYGSTGVYYSGPAGGGGTITSSTTTTGGGYGVNIGNRGYNVRLRNRTNTTTTTTTVTTTR